MYERDELLRTVCERPDDDNARLVLADWFEEHDQPLRAEFIRLQIRIAELEAAPPSKGVQKLIETVRGRVSAEYLGYLAKVSPELTRLRNRAVKLLVAWDSWLDGTFKDWSVVCVNRQEPTSGAYTSGVVRVTFRRGFVDEVAGPLNALFGRRCPGCPDLLPGHSCRKCGGGGLVNNCGREVFTRLPVSRVTLIDCRPIYHEPTLEYGPADRPVVTRWAWGNRPRMTPEFPHVLPMRLWRKLPSAKGFSEAYNTYLNYETEQRALDELAVACLALGREEAGFET